MSSLALDCLRVLYLFAPLLVSAALSAVIQRYDLWSQLSSPIDGGRSFHGRRLFGDGKTWRGVVVAVVGSAATVFAQKYVIGARAGALALVDYSTVSVPALGAAIGGGAMLGELPNSFVKRRLGVPRGGTAPVQPWRTIFWIWDQVDLLTTTWPLLGFWIRPRAAWVVASFAIALVLHPSVAVVGWLLGARRSPR